MAAPTSFYRHLLDRFDYFDVDGDGELSRADVLPRMQDRTVTGADAAALAVLRRGWGDNLPEGSWGGKLTGYTREGLRRVEEAGRDGPSRLALHWERAYQDGCAHLLSPDLNRSLHGTEDAG